MKKMGAPAHPPSAKKSVFSVSVLSSCRLLLVQEQGNQKYMSCRSPAAGPCAPRLLSLQAEQRVRGAACART